MPVIVAFLCGYFTALVMVGGVWWLFHRKGSDG
jgi:hypothetical protein